MASQLILLIEDDTDIAAVLQQDLQEAGYRVQHASSVMQGLTMVRDKHPDLILLDLNLPRKNGREVLAEIKADENLKSIPVVVRALTLAPPTARAAARATNVRAGHRSPGVSCR